MKILRQLIHHLDKNYTTTLIIIFILGHRKHQRLTSVGTVRSQYRNRTKTVSRDINESTVSVKSRCL